MSPTEKAHCRFANMKHHPIPCFVIGKCDRVTTLTTQNMIKSHEKNKDITTATRKGGFNKKYMQSMKRDCDFKSKLLKGCYSIYNYIILYSR